MAARLIDLTAHAGMPILFVGAPTVLIGGMPAARVSDATVCPLPIAPPAPAPHATEFIIIGSPTVLTAGLPQAYVTSVVQGAGPPNIVVTGSPTVEIAGAPVTPGVNPVDDARETLQRSPSLLRDINALQNRGRTVSYGAPGSGTFHRAGNITVDPSASGDPSRLTRSLSHEMGHANYSPPYHPPEVRPGETEAEARQRFIDSNTRERLRGEGVATLRNAEVREEVLRNGGPDIGVSGRESPEYRRIAADPTLTRDERIDRIADRYGAGERPSGANAAPDYNRHYGGFYGGEWDRMRRAGSIPGAGGGANAPANPANPPAPEPPDGHEH